MPRALTNLDDLVEAGLLMQGSVPALAPLAETFRIRLTAEMAGAAAASAGVARQFLPDPAEAVIAAEELTDPIGDHIHSPAPGLTHRYPDRVILAVTQTCEVYCRFCFRRETVGAAGALPPADLDRALDYIAATPAVREVILTGGDPLSLSPRRLGDILDRLAAIPHVGLVRLHSRVPVVAPGRIDDDLIVRLDIRPAVWLVVHTNHPDEITPEAGQALRRLSRAGIPLLSQTVLLRGVNDRVEVLEALMRALVTNRVKPYYLHHCDLARGTGHFRTTIAEGQALISALRGRVSGMMVPTYVLDIPGGHGKAPLTPSAATPGPEGWQVRDWQGGQHAYTDP